MRRTPLIAGIAAAGLLLAACGSNTTASNTPAAGGGSTAAPSSGSTAMSSGSTAMSSDTAMSSAMSSGSAATSSGETAGSSDSAMSGSSGGAAGSSDSAMSGSSSGSAGSAGTSSADSGAASGGGVEASKVGDGGAGGNVGIFTWWAAGSEKLGLDALTKVYGTMYPKDKFVNLAVAGGAGSNAKAKLASDLQNGNAPDSFQGHAGAELTDYIDAGQIEPVDEVITSLGGEKVFPKDLLDRLTVNGKIYSVPSNIHRANVVWVNSSVLKKASIDPAKAPADINAWIADMDKLKAAGISTPLSLGGTWTQVELFETVLISDLGGDGYNGLFDGKTKWDDPKVKQAIADYAKLLTYANTPADGDDWPPATDMVIEGKAAYNVMGDWAVAEFTSKGKKDGVDYNYWAVPGQDGVYDFLADSFTLPKGAKNAAGTKDWLMTVGSAAGQKAFNMAKGSIPARTDVTSEGFPPYQKWAMGEFKKDTIVSSIAHGAAVSLSWNTAMQAAMSKFMSTKDQAGLQSDLVSAASDNLGG
jgi:glucose/mannose transport system substrate-binding protein